MGKQSKALVVVPGAVREPSSALEQVPQTPQAEAETDGLVVWQAVLLGSWTKIAADYKGKPAPRDAMRWLKAHGPRDSIPKNQSSHNALAWIDLEGNAKTVSLKTIQNLFSEWKKAGKIPT
jgi:hypothetical protein